MTTIATDGHSMAGDTLTTGGGERLAFHDKVCRLPDGRIYGCAGLATDAAKFGRWLRDEGEHPKLDDKFAALILTPDGEIFWIGNELEPVKFLSPMTIGSGGAMALGAMLAGKSPAEAVKIAMQRDISSGGEVTCHALGDNVTNMRAVA